MSPTIAKRLLMFSLTVFCVCTVVFFLIHVIPGDPAALMLGESAEPGDVDALRQQLGLDKPLMTQYSTYLAGLMRLDLGRSLWTKEPVLSRILDRYPATLTLAIAAMLFAVVFAIPAGVMAAIKPNSWLDRASMFLAVLGVSIPNFFLGLVLILVFSIELNLLPVSGRGGIEHLILPAITLGLGMSAILARMTRAQMIESLGSDYVRTARAKGLSEFKVVAKHALRNALTPVITILGLQMGALLTGAIITETIFSWEGIGSLMVQSIGRRDYPQVEACVLVIAITYVLANLLADITYRLLDPRIRL
ncbi:MAG: ABC transporter permease [Candidatus Coatesbacteria bacterium]|nr:ABC transporter permease [Candidatus Coatesbacteria bacterium]